MVGERAPVSPTNPTTFSFFISQSPSYIAYCQASQELQLAHKKTNLEDSPSLDP